MASNSNIRRRIERLIKAGLIPCDICGQDGSEEYKIEILHHDERPDLEPGTEHCPRCGRVTRVHIKLEW